MQGDNRKALKWVGELINSLIMKKKFLIAISIIFAVTLGIQSYVYAAPAQQIKITTSKPTGSLKWSGNRVYAEIKNRTKDTVYVSWTITARDSYGETVVVGSGSCSLDPQETYTSEGFEKTSDFSNYKLELSY